jgi:hypothetical protein
MEVRAVPHLYPAWRMEGASRGRVEDMFETRPGIGIGAYEGIIETPDHDSFPETLPLRDQSDSS